MTEGKKENTKRTAAFMTGFILFVMLFTAVSLLTVKLGIKLGDKDTADTVLSESGYLAVIDAGHGGEDGGCSSGDILEKDLNLDVAKRVSQLCSLFGIDSVMTRTDDRMLYDMYGDLSDYTGKKKMYDLKNRVKFAKEKGASAFVSIHMNKFPDPSCCGMQVYYAEKTDGSLELAKMIKEYDSALSGGKREIKKAKSSIYVLSSAKCPAVLVECGFLSNQSDAERLSTNEGKMLCATVIASALFKHSAGGDGT